MSIGRKFAALTAYVEEEIYERCKIRAALEKIEDAENEVAVDPAEVPELGAECELEDTWKCPPSGGWFGHPAQYRGARVPVSKNAAIVRQVPLPLFQKGAMISGTTKGPDWQNEGGISRTMGYATK